MSEKINIDDSIDIYYLLWKDDSIKDSLRIRGLKLSIDNLWLKYIPLDHTCKRIKTSNYSELTFSENLATNKQDEEKSEHEKDLTILLKKDD